MMNTETESELREQLIELREEIIRLREVLADMRALYTRMAPPPDDDFSDCAFG